jgi:uncharacterized protein YjbI with pentapeptide repeats
MTNVLTEISAAEIVKRILGGERDFASTRIAADKGDFSRADGFEEANRYLQGQTDLRENPINASGGDWRGVKAVGLFLNALKAPGINLEGADLRDSDFRRSDMSGANFRNANVSGTTFVGCRLMEADFTDAIMRSVDLYEANLTKGKLVNADLTRAYTLRLNLGEVDMTGATMTNANLYRSDLRGAIGLETVRDLGTCQFKHTAVTKREKDVIEAAMNALPLFDLRTE